jgi:hypothetical protein
MKTMLFRPNFTPDRVKEVMPKEIKNPFIFDL